MEIIAVNSSLILEKLEEKNDNILLPEVDGFSIKAKVVSCGPNVITCKEGDNVLFFGNHAVPFDVGDKRYYSIEENRVICIFRNENNETES